MSERPDLARIRRNLPQMLKLAELSDDLVLRAAMAAALVDLDELLDWAESCEAQLRAGAEYRRSMERLERWHNGARRDGNDNEVWGR